MVRVVGIEEREYQKKIFQVCKDYNTLVILPTGMGKTIIALLLAAHRLNEYEDSKVFFLAPTKPLVHQHRQLFLKHLDEIDKTRLIVITGDIPPDIRKNKYKFGKIIFVTPQTLQNDLIQGRVSLEDVSLIIFDECHRAIGKYPYVFIAKKYIEDSKYPRILGITASPGSDIERIKKIIENLFIEKIEIRVGYERDIRKYMKPLEIKREIIEFSEEEKEIDQLLKKALEIRIEKLKEKNIISRKPKGKKELLSLINEIKEKISNNSKDIMLKEAFKIASELVMVEHAIEMFETQTFSTFIKYIESIFSKDRKGPPTKGFEEDIRIRKAYALVKNLIKKKEHPKLEKLVKIVKENVEKKKDIKIIVFAQIRETVKTIYNFLSKEGISCKIFTGKSEMKREEQIRVLNEFKEGKFNVLIATSIGEEGIDIPKVDLVIFYEPVPSEIRYIQRRGRTGRGDIGRVIILITKGTRDEIFAWASFFKERKMLKLVKELKKELSDKGKEMTLKLENFFKLAKSKKVKEDSSKKENTNIYKKIIADIREKESGVVQELVSRGYFVELKSLDVGDYIVGEWVIERKTVKDFVESISDGRLWDQLEKLSKVEKKILIIEGEENMYLLSNLSPNYIRSIILKILLNYKIPILWSKNYKDTANYLELLSDGKESKIIKMKKKKKSKEEIYIEILKTIPGIGENLAKKLVEKFGNLYNIIHAPLVELERILGEKRAKLLKEIFEGEEKDKKLRP